MTSLENVQSALVWAGLIANTHLIPLENVGMLWWHCEGVVGQRRLRGHCGRSRHWLGRQKGEREKMEGR